MSQEMVEKLLGRLLTDDYFRQRAVQSIAESCREEGFLLSGEELESIQQEDLVFLEWVRCAWTRTSNDIIKSRKLLGKLTSDSSHSRARACAVTTNQHVSRGNRRNKS